MAMKIIQKIIEQEDLQDNNILLDSNNKTILLVKQLGIQASPGQQFKINNGKQLTIGKSGIFELSTNLFCINSLIFIKNENYKKIIVDILYEDNDNISYNENIE